MNAFREELRLSRELATSHRTLFAAALLADVGILLPLALATLAGRHRRKVPVCSFATLPARNNS